MFLIGLTGGIGAGKSTVSAALAERGSVIIDADAITRALQEPGLQVFDAMVSRFGSGIVAPNGTLDRAAVAALVFTDPAALADLNAMVHPAVGSEIAARLTEFATTDRVVVLDVPLLVESGRDDMALLVVVDIDPELAVHRLVTHRGFSEVDARNRISRLANREDRLARADFVVNNSGDRAALDVEIARLWTWIEAKYHEANHEENKHESRNGTAAPTFSRGPGVDPDRFGSD